MALGFKLGLKAGRLKDLAEFAVQVEVEVAGFAEVAEVAVFAVFAGVVEVVETMLAAGAAEEPEFAA